MTIPINELERGAWYDGFMKKAGRQIGVVTLQWSPALELFYHPIADLEHHYPHIDDPKGDWSEWAFEPNVISIGEPAA